MKKVFIDIKELGCSSDSVETERILKSGGMMFEFEAEA